MNHMCFLKKNPKTNKPVFSPINNWHPKTYLPKKHFSPFSQAPLHTLFQVIAKYSTNICFILKPWCCPRHGRWSLLLCKNMMFGFMFCHLSISYAGSLCDGGCHWASGTSCPLQIPSSEFCLLRWSTLTCFDGSVLFSLTFNQGEDFSTATSFFLHSLLKKSNTQPVPWATS